MHSQLMRLSENAIFLNVKDAGSVSPWSFSSTASSASKHAEQITNVDCEMSKYAQPSFLPHQYMTELLGVSKQDLHILLTLHFLNALLQ